jgi:hypothetical protein
MSESDRSLTGGPPASSIDADPVTKLAALLERAYPLVRQLLEDATAEERQRLREVLGGDGLFNVSTALNLLCSERARLEGFKRGYYSKDW